MKRSMLFLLTASLTLASSIVVSAGNISFTDNRSEAATASFEESDFETEEFLYVNSIGSVSYYVAVTNNSEATVEVKGSGDAFDADGNVLATKNMYIDILGPGETSIGYFWFGDTEGVDKVEYSLEYEKEDYYKPVLNDLAFDATVNDKNVTLTATNNGKYNAQFVEAYALFLDADGKVVRADSVYLTDDDSEIKVGATISGQLDCNDEFADVKLFVTGRSDGSASSKSDFDDSKVDITEHLFESGSATYDYVVIANNSDKTVGIKGNGLAKNSDGGVIGAANMSIDILAPGEESVGFFYFSGVKGVDKVDYTMFYDTDPYYAPVINDLSVDASINENNVIAIVTNNGEKAAQFVEVYCLFMDADNNILRADSTYITDNDYEIKPGATISGQLDCRDAFDHVELYLTGRADK